MDSWNPPAPGDGVTPQLARDTMVDAFRVKRLLAEGAMGAVYLAVDERLGRLVALKFLKSSAFDDAAVAGFLEESRTTAAFSHPHIVTVYGVGVFLGRPYIAMEYLDGETLRDRFSGGPLPVREVMRLGRALAEALAEAHRHGVVHADFKPENVVVPRDGRARVVDFGLSQHVGRDDTSTSGTPAYMAPERWGAAPPAPPMDVWGLAMVLCEALDGRRPVSERELVQLSLAPRPVSLGRVSLASPCGPLLARCLSARPEDRPMAEEVARELDALMSGRGGSDEHRSPFRGLESFSESDAADFRGREAEVDLVVERLRRDGLVPVIGPSGVGKSSFLQAGVVPRLREAGPLLVVTCRPGRRPLTSVRQSLEALGVDGLSELLGLVREAPGALLRSLRCIAAAKSRPVVLIIDQFEEVVTLGEEAEARALMRALAVTALPGEPARVLIAVRSDFLGRFAETDLQPSLAAVTVLKPFGRRALEEAVLAPLTRVGFRPDRPDLPSRIAMELEGQAAALPLLQFACEALWRRRDAGRRVVLTQEYEAMGGAAGALATHAERMVHNLDDSERAFTRALMLQLVNVDGTRRPRPREELLSQAGQAAAVALDRLLQLRLLVSGQEEATGQPLIELAHESLVSAWPAFTRWLAETQEARLLAHQIEQAAALWDGRGRRDAETWVGDALRDAQRRVELWALKLSPLQKGFLEAGAVREARLRLRRRARVGGAFISLALLALAGVTAALVYRDKEREAVAQQEEIRLAAADMGRFELILEPYDWDPVEMVPRPARAESLPRLDWKLHDLATGGGNFAGPMTNPQYVRRGERRAGEDGLLHEVVEVRSAGGWLELDGRGAGLSDCGPSWLLVRHFPGYAERSAGRVLRLKVPTCQATLAGTVLVPAGPFWVKEAGQKDFTLKELPAYRIDAYEVTEEAFRIYGSMSDLTGDVAVPLPGKYLAKGLRKLPMTQIDYPTSERYCRFLGKRVETADEWRKAGRGGLWLDGERTVANPRPQRVTPWGDENPRHAQLCLPGQEGDILPVGQFPDDRGPSGAYDISGGRLEWTSDIAPPSNENAGLQVVVGGSGLSVVHTTNKMYLLDASHERLPGIRDLSTGVRCVRSE